MKKLLTSALLALFIAQNAEAGLRTDSTETGLNLSLGIGFTQIDLQTFNDAATANGFPTFKDGIRPTLSFGFYMHEPTSRFVSDLQGHFVFPTKINGNGFKARHSASTIDLNFGYAVVNNERHFFAPSLGLGTLSHGIQYNADFSSQNFNTTLQNISGERKYNSNWNIYLNPRLTYDFKLSSEWISRLGVIVGYRIGINTPRWRVADNQKVLDAPKSNGNGFYGTFRVTF